MKKKNTNKKNNKEQLNTALVILSVIITIIYSFYTLQVIFDGYITLFTIILIIPYILFAIGIIKKRKSFIISTIICQLLILLLAVAIDEFIIKPTREPEHFNIVKYERETN